MLKMKNDTAKDKSKKITVPLYSDFFSSFTENIICTNAMYSTLHSEIEASVYPYGTNVPILLSVYESSNVSDKSVFESALIGFGKYITQLRKNALSELTKQLFSFSSLAVLGIILEYLYNNVFEDILPVWINALFEIVAWVFVWESAEFITFSLPGIIKNIRRLSQILHIEYEFHHWE